MKKKEENVIPILTSIEVCKILRISLRTLQTYRYKRMIAFSQIGRKIYYNVDDIDNFLFAHHVKPNKPTNE